MDELKILKTFDEVVDHLVEIKENTSNQQFIQYANTQIQVIKLIQEPVLVASCFDTFFFHLKKMIDSCDISEQKIMIQEKAQLFCQNFIFFTKAKLSYEEACLIQEEEDLILHKYNLLADATKILTEALVNAPQHFSINLKDGKIKVDINSILEPFKKIYKEKGIIDKFFDLFQKDKKTQIKREKIKLKKEEFNLMLIAFVDTLYRYRDLIGKSSLIAGMIKNYETILIEQPAASIKHKENEKIAQIKNDSDENVMTILGLGAGVIILYGVILLLILILYGISLIFTDGSYIGNWLMTSLRYWLIPMGIASVIFIISFIYKVIGSRAIKKAEQEKSRILQNHFEKYNEIHKYFHPESANLSEFG